MKAMGPHLAIFFALSFLGLAFTGAAVGLGYRLAFEENRKDQLAWLLAWFIKGLFLPLVLWMVMNFGISWDLQPFMPQVQEAQNSGKNWLPVYLRVVGTGAFILSSYWAALTLIWALARASRGLEDESRSNLRALCLTCGIGLGIPAAGIVWLGGWPVVGLGAVLMAAPAAGYAPSLLRPRKLPPMYARAIARVKFGKYSEAEWEIIRQLEKREDDFDGWMMLAELYANNFNDLPEAEQTILEICDQPRTTPSQISVALHRLADWHLKMAADPDAARRDLQMVCDRLPGTHLARMARVRLEQLPASVSELREQQIARPIPMPALGDSLDEAPGASLPEADPAGAAELANACVERLTRDPNDIPARERLARLLTERLHKVDLGLEQVTLLLNLPDVPDAKRAEWLGWLGAWHLRYRQDTDTARKILERLVREFPDSPQAFAARRRLQLLDVEYRG